MIYSVNEPIFDVLQSRHFPATDVLCSNFFQAFLVPMWTLPKACCLSCIFYSKHSSEHIRGTTQDIFVGVVDLWAQQEGHISEVLTIDHPLPVPSKCGCADVDIRSVLVLWQGGGRGDSRLRSGTCCFSLCGPEYKEGRERREGEEGRGRREGEEGRGRREGEEGRGRREGEGRMLVVHAFKDKNKKIPFPPKPGEPFPI